VRGIDVGFLVDTHQVSYGNVRQLAAGAVSDGRCEGGASGDLVYDRVPLAIDVATDTGSVTFVSVHFKSKFGGTPANNFFEDCRVEQAETLLGELDATTQAVVLGDLNAFRDAATLDAFEANGFTNLVNSIPEDRRFSFVFEGRVQFLDHILVSDALVDAVADVDSPKISSDVPFPVFEDDAATGLATSDHDPLVAGFEFTSE
ncbi:MAG: hypothetical protein R3320_07190, partial [Nitriliruptorales bacterium]|nr:hypothetical protein [Nitriliruptorales bacterium]